MKIYVCHSTKFDYKKELYEPIRDSSLNNQYEFIFPHENSSQSFDSKNIIPKCNLVISEISYPSTPMGIELGWANKDNVKIVFIYKQGTKVSDSLKAVSSDFIEYVNSIDLIEKLQLFIEKL